ncbi:Cytochrome b-c1 complex subunit 6 [Porphyridium purpureum]|uniref:Cytochrome b-c1 complex subunit 6 n=1 Tax=Porphyridium purpureum TaxID=35688 RepID=A0A5J4Z6H9_PORPP|nr:Cytochrome b-c1 complex subunit 6 [Porphyridium purpureum]|eukprot:POR4579..scf295_1
MADEVVDLRPEIEEKCKPQCSKVIAEYEACKERIKSDTTGEAHCTGQYLDLFACIDKCAMPKVFSTLK